MKKVVVEGRNEWKKRKKNKPGVMVLAVVGSGGRQQREEFDCSMEQE